MLCMDATLRTITPQTVSAALRRAGLTPVPRHGRIAGLSASRTHNATEVYVSSSLDGDRSRARQLAAAREALTDAGYTVTPAADDEHGFYASRTAAPARAPRRRYVVRRQSSGYTTSDTYYVHDLTRAARVTATPHRDRLSAQADADALEVAAMVPPHAEDPRPYAVRHAEATARFAAGATAR